MPKEGFEKLQCMPRALEDHAHVQESQEKGLISHGGLTLRFCTSRKERLRHTWKLSRALKSCPICTQSPWAKAEIITCSRRLRNLCLIITWPLSYLRGNLRGCTWQRTETWEKPSMTVTEQTATTRSKNKLGEGRNLISGTATLTIYYVCFSTTTTAAQRNRKVRPLHREKKQSMKTISEGVRH